MKLKEARQRLELTQEQAATRLGLSVSTYRKYESAGKGGRSGGYSIERANQAVRNNYDAMMKEADAIEATDTPTGDTLGRQGRQTPGRSRQVKP